MMEPTELDRKKVKAVGEMLKHQSPEDRERTLNYIIQKHMDIIAAKHGLELSMMSPEWLEKTRAEVRKALTEVPELG